MKAATATCIAAAMTFGAALLSTTSMVKAEDKRPNIVMLMTDDVGWNDFGAYSGGGAALGSGLID
jgi:hypothetical protein